MLKMLGLVVGGLCAGLIIFQLLLRPSSSSLRVVEPRVGTEAIDDGAVDTLPAEVREQLAAFERRLDEMAEEIAALREASVSSNSDEAAHANRVAESATATASASDQTSGHTEAELRDMPLVELRALAATSRSGAVRYELDRRQRIEKWSNEAPPTQPITLGSDFAWLADHPSPVHEQLQREPYDPYWSAITEGQIATFLAEHPEITQKYGQPTVHCRTSGCELAFVAYGIGETSSFDLMLDGTFAAVSEQPWGGQFPDPGATSRFIARHEGDATTILWFLTKEPTFEFYR